MANSFVQIKKEATSQQSPFWINIKQNITEIS